MEKADSWRYYLPGQKTAQIFPSSPNSGEHNISYRPRTAVKGQILADFLIEKPETDAVLPQSEVKLQEPWILFIRMDRHAWERVGRSSPP
ncbi:hypothetical protein Tco_0676513 [Tanacetum coccineum]